ncbi:serpin family protein, partial [bacterium]|nr:serpin family protein [bacterium]
MKTIIVRFGIICGLIAIWMSVVHAAVVDDVIEKSNSLGNHILVTSLKTDPTRNVVISPPSITVILGILGNGIQGNTRREWLKEFGLTRQNSANINRGFSLFYSVLTDPSLDVVFESANSLWITPTTMPSEPFRKLSVQYFDSTIEPVDFKNRSSIGKINGWVSKHTHGMIPDFLTSVDPDTVLMAVNAVYFKGEWSRAFDPDDTDFRYFFSNGSATRLVPFMKMTGKFKYLETDTAQAAILPYGEGRFELVVVAPFRWQSDAISTELFSIDSADLFDERTGTLIFPKFKADSSQSVKTALSNTGFGRLFQSSADFSLIHP